MNAWLTVAAIPGCLIGLAYGYRAWRTTARRLAAIKEEFKTPAPEASTPRAPGPYPGEGVPAGPPNPNAGGPSPGLEPRLLMSSRFYSDGVVYVDDHIKRTTRRFDPPPGDDLEVTDAEIERWLNDGV